jgi:solute:Na+ symporter, SSS family
VTLLTSPEPDSKLREFYERVRPARIGWRRFATNDGKGEQSLLWATADWVAGCTMIYCSLFGIGKIILGSALAGVGLLAIAGACAFFIFWDLNRRGWETLTS